MDGEMVITTPIQKEREDTNGSFEKLTRETNEGNHLHKTLAIQTGHARYILFLFSLKICFF